MEPIYAKIRDEPEKAPRQPPIRSLATREQLMRHRTLTVLNNAFESYRIEQGADKGSRLNTYTAFAQQSQQSRVARAMRDFTTLAVMHHQITAMVPTGFPNGKIKNGGPLVMAMNIDDDGEQDDIDELASRGGVGSQIIASNPRENPRKASQLAKTALAPCPPPSVHVSVVHMPTIDTPTSHDAFVQQLVEMLYSTAGVEIPAESHLATLQSFLARMIGSPDDLTLWDMWREYVMFACHAKIHTRLSKAKVDLESTKSRITLRRNIWLHFTKSTAQIEEAFAKKRNVNQDFPSTVELSLTPHMRSFLQQFEVPDLADTTTLSYEDFLPSFHKIFAGIFEACDSSITTLAAAIKKNRTDHTAVGWNFNAFKSALAAATVAYNQLFVLKRHFSAFIGCHLVNIQNAFDLAYTTHDAVQKVVTPDGELIPPSRMKVDNQAAEELAGEHEDAVELENLYEREDDGWSAAADRYIELCLSHANAATELALRMSQPVFAQAIAKSPLRLLKVTQDYEDREMADITTTVERAGGGPGLIDWLKKNQKHAMDKPSFNGRLHAEAIILTVKQLHIQLENWKLLPTDGNGLNIKFDPKTPKLPLEIGINEANRKKWETAIESYREVTKFSISQEALDLCGEIAPVLAVSKRCCPTCTFVVNSYEDRLKEGNKKALFVQPDSHTTWTATTLPPWTMEHVVLKAIERSEAELRLRYNTLCELKQGTKNRRKPTSSDDTGTPSQAEVVRSPQKKQRVDKVLPLHGSGSS